MKLPTLAQAEKALGEPATEWVARCYEIAGRIVGAKLCPPGSVAVYGHWLGPIAENSYFHEYSTAPFVRHGWVLLPDGRVLDPTRWVFEDAKPYLYIGPSDQYDEGGNEWRDASHGAAPSFTPSDRVYTLDVPRSTCEFLKSLLPSTLTDLAGQLVVDAKQLAWLANMSPQKLGPHALPVFTAICKTGSTALIPIDNLRRIERENRVALTVARTSKIS